MEVSTAFVFFIGIFQNVSPFWSSYFQLQPCLHLISNNFQRLQTVGCDPWVWPLVRVSGRWRGESQPSLATPSSPAVEIVGNLAVGSSFTSKQQHNEPTAHCSRRRFLAYLGGRADVLRPPLGLFLWEFFRVKAFPHFSISTPSLDIRLLRLSSLPPPLAPLLPYLSSPPLLSVLPAWIYCLFGWGAHLDLILPVEPSCLSPLCAGRY